VLVSVLVFVLVVVRGRDSDPGNCLQFFWKM
jgi:hypothetical protein